MSNPIITTIKSVPEFYSILNKNPGLVILKLGAEWCGPCKQIEQDVNVFVEMRTSNIKCCIIDVDECVELYSFLKSKRVVNGIPVLLAYVRGNVTHVPNDVVIGSNKNELYMFFDRCWKISLVN